jgi:hypothetical protein
LIVVKLCPSMFQRAPITISTYKHQLCGNCDASILCVFLRLVVKMSDRLLEQRINIKFCVKQVKKKQVISAVLSVAYRGEDMKN